LQIPGVGVYIIPIYLPMTLGGFVRAFMYEVVNEKAEKYKEYLRINGLSSLAYYLHLILFGFMRILLICLIIFAGIALAGEYNPFSQAQLLEFLASYLLYGLATINLCLSLSTLFSTAKLASDLSGLIFTLLLMVYYAIINTSSKVIYYLGGLIPGVSLAYGLVSSLSELPPNIKENMPNLNASTLIQVFNCFLYFLLFVVLDQIIPDEFGIKRSLCHKRKKNQKRKITNNLKEPLMEPVQEEVSDERDYSSAQYHEPFENSQNLKKSIFIKNLVKRFGDSTVIQGITMMVYEGQIFCLLGHNGAGKTTTINILTGILEADEGDIMYGNLDFREDFEQIRRTLGFCAQKDILYSELTVEEHLRMIAAVRGVPENDVEAEINSVIEKIGIQRERTKRASALSGGNKRKLCLAMATIGKTKIIFLDEPTSGLDPNSRRLVWDTLRSLKNEGITLLLTTHFLDEADELADRIAILAKGKLHSIGTSHFLKKTFGEGYQLIITPKYEGSSPQEIESSFSALKETLHNTVKQYIPTSQLDLKTPPDMIKFSLPFSSADKFADVFETIEQIPNIQFSLEMNTLEDAFINIGVEQENQENQDDQRIEIAPVPKTIAKNPEYKFADQFSAIFKRKFLCTIRSPQNIIMSLFPIIFLVLSCFLANLQTDSVTQAIQFSQMTALAFGFNASIYCGFPVMEREQKLKYALKVMGCRTIPYWLGTFAFDIIIIAFLMGCLIVIAYILETTFLINNIGYFVLAAFAFGTSLLANAYMYGFMFDKSQSAYKYYGMFCIFILYYLPMISSLVFFQDEIKWAGNICMYLGMATGPFIPFLQEVLTYVPYVNESDFVISQNPLVPILMLFGQAIIFMSITIWLESRKYNLSQKSIKKALIPYAPNPIFDATEINSEAERVAAENNLDPIRVLGLEKAYENGFQAVRGISFGVEKKQIFGLLGPNGAGKSTTFNILTALIPRTKGSVKLLQTEIDQNLYEIFKEVGICPQFDCLWESLTVREHLEIFGSMKGLHGQDLQENIDYFITTMQLSDHINKKSKILSGGNKRKLCVTNALIGSPSLQFFDEPSTGLDPVARRYLYDTLVANLNNREATIILTTHSLTEAELLCHKIGILINGKFVCIGSTPYLKNKYGTGYRITIPKHAVKNADVFERELTARFENIKKIYDHSQEFYNYQVSMEGFSFAKAFKSLQEMKEAQIIEDYSLTNTSLEQIFLNFSKFQEVRDE
jgi:ABC-type multidrug transport system, ATPase component